MTDFERFTASVKLAYRRCGGSAYSLEDVLHVFRYYLSTYEYIMGKAHPPISIEQAANIISEMPFLPDDNHGGAGMLDISPEEYEAMIDQHFKTKYNRGNCDYNINHFFSGKIRYMRFYEVCY